MVCLLTDRYRSSLLTDRSTLNFELRGQISEVPVSRECLCRDPCSKRLGHRPNPPDAAGTVFQRVLGVSWLLHRRVRFDGATLILYIDIWFIGVSSIAFYVSDCVPSAVGWSSPGNSSLFDRRNGGLRANRITFGDGGRSAGEMLHLLLVYRMPADPRRSMYRLFVKIRFSSIGQLSSVPSAHWLITDPFYHKPKYAI